MIEDVLTLVADKWNTLLPSVGRPRRFSFVLQSRNRVTLFLFDADSSHSVPLAVVKLARTPEQNLKLVDTAAKTQLVRSMLPLELSQTVPQVVVLGEVCGLSCTLETTVPGTPVVVAGQGRTVCTRLSRTLRAFLEWLTQFQQYVVTGHTYLDYVTVERTIASLASCLDGNAALRFHQLIAELGTAADGLSVPQVWRMGDTHPSNILLKDGRVSGVVDWEGAAPDQWPFHDWLHFTFSYTAELQKWSGRVSDPVERVRLAMEMLLGPPSSPMASVLQLETKRFLKAVGLSWDHMPLWCAIFLGQYWWKGDKIDLLRRVLPVLWHVPR